MPHEVDQDRNTFFGRTFVLENSQYGDESEDARNGKQNMIIDNGLGAQPEA